MLSDSLDDGRRTAFRLRLERIGCREPKRVAHL